MFMSFSDIFYYLIIWQFIFVTKKQFISVLTIIVRNTEQKLPIVKAA